MMKKLFALGLILFLFTACSNDDGYDFYYEILPVESVDIPEEFIYGETYPITVSYLRPTTCHYFREFYYKKVFNERTVAPVTYVLEKDDCEDFDAELVESSFNFVVTGSGPYVFKFWQGEDEQGEDQYLIIEVPVVGETES